MEVMKDVDRHARTFAVMVLLCEVADDEGRVS
jgi:hypothetical protein